MKPSFLFLAVTFCSYAVIAISPANAATSIPLKPLELNKSRQIIVVNSNNWDNSQAYLQPYERSGPGQPWHVASAGWPVVVGSKGMAWGNNLKNEVKDGPFKQEGDKKSPAGVYAIGPAFGFAPKPDPQLKLTYIPVTPTLLCVDDSKSRYYGKIIDTSKIAAKDWNSGEVLINYKQDYIKGIVVKYNIEGNMSHGGSCIFLHIEGPALVKGTHGCTAMTETRVTWLWHWLDPKAHPLLVQMPKAQYLKVQKAWGLPSL
jgi:zinc D-Ala-D-Ala dipeptidase